MPNPVAIEICAPTGRRPAGASNAIPYDTSLKVAYLGKYPFKTVNELYAGTGPLDPAGVKLEAHYGDWPDVELLAKNQAENAADDWQGPPPPHTSAPAWRLRCTMQRMSKWR